MYSLIIDSATKLLYIALVDDEKVLFEKYISGFNDHAKHIVLEIENALKENSLKALDLARVITGVGPGSYTGVRMSVTVAKTFACLSDIKLYSISTLKLMSSGYDETTLTAIDARHGMVFGAIYNNMEEVVPECLIDLEELKKNEYNNIATESMFKVDALKVSKCATLVSNPFTLIPNYLRDTEAERNLKHD